MCKCKIYQMTKWKIWHLIQNHPSNSKLQIWQFFAGGMDGFGCLQIWKSLWKGGGLKLKIMLIEYFKNYIFCF